MDAEIRLIAGVKQGRSYLRSLYVTPPFRVVGVGQLHNDGKLYLMQMSTSPGILSGDSYKISITVEDNASLQLQSQSYQRIYDMEQSASQTMDITIGDNALFSQVPHPLVPHKNSYFSQKTKVQIGENSSFLQGEIITCGRKHHGEEFLFRHFSNSVEVFCGDKLRLKDMVYLEPKNMPLKELGLLEGATHQGTLIFQSTQNIDINSLIETIYEILQPIESIRFGISSTFHPGFVIRALSDGGEVLYDSFCKVQNYIFNNRGLLKTDPFKLTSL